MRECTAQEPDIRESDAWGCAHATVSVKSTSTRLSYRLEQINRFGWDITVSDDILTRAETEPRRPRLLVALAVMLFIEAGFLGVVAVFLLFELATEVPTSLASAIGILVLVLVAAVWLVVVGVGALHAKPWVRAAALTWQILQLAIAVGSFQGLFARDDIAWFLLVPAVIVIALLFSRSVMTATRRI